MSNRKNRNQSESATVESTRYSVLTQDQPEIEQPSDVAVSEQPTVELAPELQAMAEWLNSKVDPDQIEAFLKATNLRGIKVKAERKPREPKPTRLCLCGCGTETKALFAMGHDAKVKSVLLARSQGKVVKTSLGNQNMDEWMPSDELKAYIESKWTEFGAEPWIAIPLVVKPPKPPKASKAKTVAEDVEEELHELVSSEIEADEAFDGEFELETEIA